jgi:hypothetical protein
MVTVKFDKTSANRLARKLERMAQYGDVNAKELNKINRNVAKIYVKTARRNIQPMDREFTTVRGNRITPGTLKRSMGVWRPKGSKATMMAGPRAGTLKRVAAYSNKDGFFAHFVEAGVARNTKYQGTNVGVFARSLKSAMPQMQQKQLSDYRANFSKFVRKA